MSFFDLVRREMQGSLKRLVVMSSLGGVSTASILAAINAGAQAADNGKFQSLGGDAFRRRAGSLHQDAALRSDHHDRRNRSHHPQSAAAPDGSRAALRAPCRRERSAARKSSARSPGIRRRSRRRAIRSPLRRRARSSSSSSQSTWPICRFLAFALSIAIVGVAALAVPGQEPPARRGDARGGRTGKIVCSTD